MTAGDAGQLSGGHAVVDSLERAGVELVFGIPGTHNLEIYRYLVDSRIRHVTPRHEQGGGYAADAYARVSGRAGVLLTTTGPGLTNACTAIGTAYADSVPLLVISPGMPTGKERLDLGWLHELKDQHAHLAAITDRSHRVSTAVEAADVIDEAFARWQVERPRPVHVEIPVDVLEAAYQPQPARPRPKQVAQLPDVGEAARALAGCTDVVMIVGGGGRRACDEVRRIAELLEAPVVTTVNGKGVLPESHPLSLGASIRVDEAHEVIAAADGVLEVGTELGDSELWGQVVSPHETVVRVDIDPAQRDKNLLATHPLIADAAAVLTALIEALDPLPRTPAAHDVAALRERCDEGALREGRPFVELHDVLKEVLPVDAIIAGDSAQVSYFGTAHQWPAVRPGQFVYPAGYATLGYGIPGGIGAALAAPDRAVVVLAGDGGTMFSIQEFATAVDLRLALPVVVLNNGGFAEIREGMRARGIAPVGVDVRSPDFALLGQALGGAGVRVDSTAAVGEHVQAALAREVPTLIELRTT